MNEALTPVDPYRQFFGLPVALQLAHPYIAISPLVDEHGPVVQTVDHSDGTARTIGVPAMPTVNSQTGAGVLQVLLGVLRATDCGTRLILTMGIARPRAQVEVLLRPEQIAVVTAITAVEAVSRIALA